MADPLSGLSAATNVLQFVEVGLKLIWKSKEVYKSTTGLCEEHNSLEIVASNLQRLNADIEQRSSADPQGQAAQNVHRANQHCLALSSEFLQLFGTLKPAQDRSKRWQSIKVVAKAMWSQDKLRRLENNLAHSRNNLMLSLLGLLKTQNEDIAASIARCSHRSQQDFIENLCKLGISSDFIPNAGVNGTDTARLRDLLALVSVLEQPEKRDGSSQINLSPLQQLHTVENEIEYLAATKERTMRKLMQSLLFFELDGWQEHIESAHPDTFAWMWDQDPPSAQAGENFTQWLRSTGVDGLYWIRGKAGSGKSTLMRFLHSRLQQHITDTGWIAHSQLVIASVFLSHGSNTIQRSVLGLFRSLLYQIWREVPEIISDAVPVHKWVCALQADAEAEVWSIEQLRSALDETLRLTGESTHSSVSILFLVDGLDEYQGTDEEKQSVVEYIRSAVRKPHVKACVASRPSVILQCALQPYPQICLEEMTEDDIRTYVSDKLCADQFYRKLQLRVPELTVTLRNDIVARSNGVFLWAQLAVRDILKVIRDGGDVSQLRTSLRALPVDLEQYYMQMLQAVPAGYRRDASIIMQIALFDIFFAPDHRLGSRAVEDTMPWQNKSRQHQLSGPCFLLLYLRDLAEDGMPNFVFTDDFEAIDLSNDEEIEYWLEILKRRLLSRCGGILEVTRMSERRSPKWNIMITFLHRSAKDFLMTPKVQQLLHEWSGGPFDVHTFRYNTLATDVVSFSNPATVDKLHILRLYATSCLMTLLTQDRGQRKQQQVFWKLFDWLLPQLRLDSDEWSCLNTGPRIGVSDTLLDITGQWCGDQSDPMSLAVAFGWTSYVHAHISSDSICRKKGRPLLDYALRPCRNRPREPLPDLVDFLLTQGADPNQMYLGASVWIHFIVALISLPAEYDTTYHSVVDRLLNSTASRQIPLSQLRVAVKESRMLPTHETGDSLDLFRVLYRFKPIQMDTNGECVLDVCNVLEAVAECGHSSQRGYLADSEELDVLADETPVTGTHIGHSPAETQQRGCERTAAALEKQPSSGQNSRSEWSAPHERVKKKVGMQAMTPEPECGYGQKP